MFFSVLAWTDRLTHTYTHTRRQTDRQTNNNHSAITTDNELLISTAVGSGRSFDTVGLSGKTVRSVTVEWTMMTPGGATVNRCSQVKQCACACAVSRHTTCQSEHSANMNVRITRYCRLINTAYIFILFHQTGSERKENTDTHTERYTLHIQIYKYENTNT